MPKILISLTHWISSVFTKLNHCLGFVSINFFITSLAKKFKMIDCVFDWGYVGGEKVCAPEMLLVGA